jgi:hypothetical protein
MNIYHLSLFFTPVSFRWTIPLNAIREKQIGFNYLYRGRRTVNALTLYWWSNPLTFNEQRIIGLCKSLTVDNVNSLKIGNGNI